MLLCGRLVLGAIDAELELKAEPAVVGVMATVVDMVGKIKWEAKALSEVRLRCSAFCAHGQYMV